MRPLSGHEEIIAPEAIFLRRLKYDERQTGDPKSGQHVAVVWLTNKSLGMRLPPPVDHWRPSSLENV